MKIALIDLFCGAGGTTTGVERAKIFGRKVAKVIACVNHDPVAISSHRANHKGVLHFTEDIRTLNLDRLLKLVAYYRAKGYIIAVWASLECTNFSNAKGGMPRDADSRTLAEHLIRYITAIQPEYVKIENVMEFMSWGDLNDLGRPVSREKGKSYIKWVDEIKALGYRHDWRKLDAADFGAHTSRKRYFGIFAKGDLPIVFPEPTHAKVVNKGSLFSNNLKPWRPVKEVLDLNDEGKSIFDRKKQLSEKTMSRIYAGLIKYVAGGKEAFMLKYNSTSQNGIHVPPSVDAPCPTVACQNRLGIVHAKFMQKYYSTTRPQDMVKSLNDPLGTIKCKDGHGIVSAKFLTKYYSSGGQLQGIDEVCGTIPTKDRFAKVSAKPFIMKTHFDNTCASLNEPHGVITANRKHSYIINPAWFGHSQGIDKPACTIVARQDKAPLYLLTATAGAFNIPIYKDDSPSMIKVKEFMALYDIVDIKMRMLNVNELLKIQGFPEGYILKGNQEQQKKFIGNSVVPIVSQLMVKETYKAVVEYFESKKAA